LNIEKAPYAACTACGTKQRLQHPCKLLAAVQNPIQQPSCQLKLCKSLHHLERLLLRPLRLHLLRPLLALLLPLPLICILLCDLQQSAPSVEHFAHVRSSRIAAQGGCCNTRQLQLAEADALGQGRGHVWQVLQVAGGNLPHPRF
jgi:hypothetical protein